MVPYKMGNITYIHTVCCKKSTLQLNYSTSRAETTPKPVPIAKFAAEFLSARHTHTHTQSFYCSSGICPGLPRWAGTRKVKIRKVKPIWIYWSKRQWVAVASAGPYTSLHLIPDNHGNISPLSFLQAGCPSCRPTNSVKALSARNFRKQIS